MKKKILIACEESQAITKAFRKLGFEAYSCDLLPCSGGHPEWHIQGDALHEAYSGKYDLMVAHPPCTYLAVSGNRWLYNKDGSINLYRYKAQAEALDFVRVLMNAPIKHIAIENPVSVISSNIRKPEQIIQPWQFGDEAQKTTCLWLKNLPKLEHTKIVGKGEEERRTLRSKTFPGIANAIAQQWGKII